jgi:hypothetical protein
VPYSSRNCDNDIPGRNQIRFIAMTPVQGRAYQPSLGKLVAELGASSTDTLLDDRDPGELNSTRNVSMGTQQPAHGQACVPSQAKEFAIPCRLHGSLHLREHCITPHCSTSQLNNKRQERTAINFSARRIVLNPALQPDPTPIQRVEEQPHGPTERLIDGFSTRGGCRCGHRQQQERAGAGQLPRERERCWVMARLLAWERLITSWCLQPRLPMPTRSR